MLKTLKNTFRMLLHFKKFYLWAAGFGAALYMGHFFIFSGVKTEHKTVTQAHARSVFTVQPAPLSLYLSLVGEIAPGKTVNVIAPFNGSIKEQYVDYGTIVEKGQIILRLDTAEIDAEIRRAEIAMIKATQALDKINNWPHSNEVTRAKNSLMSVQIKVSELALKEQENKKLLEQGIIPKNEYAQTLSQLKTLKMRLSDAEKNVEAVLKRGDEQHRHLASLELTNAKVHLEDLQKRRKNSSILAPVSGLVLRPSAPAGKPQKYAGDIEVGSLLVKDQALFSVADTETLWVRTYVDEIDVLQIVRGQSVKITGDALGVEVLNGHIHQISAQSRDNQSRASFEVITVVPSISQEQRKHVRVGMSANLEIKTYENAAAFIIPIPAVQQGENGPFVIVKNPKSNTEQQVPISIGKTTPTGIEALSGLKAGDQIILGGHGVSIDAYPQLSIVIPPKDSYG